MAYCGVLDNERCIGQTYNMVSRGFITWLDYHLLAMKVLGREVELVHIPLTDLRRMNIPNFGLCDEIFAHHIYYSSEKLYRDVPSFQPKVTLEQGMAQVFEVMDRESRVPNSDELHWEDDIISSWRHPTS